jgi:hypothetical protein
MLPKKWSKSNNELQKCIGEKMSNHSEFLYHYTNIETLALIMKNRTIRFNSLCNLDDLQEQTTQDNQNFGRFIFVSCWTDVKKESIPM